MKYFNVVIYLSIFLVMLPVSAGEQAFYSALENCKNYSSSGQTTADGMTVNFFTEISGWSEDKCIYKEKISSPSFEACTTCRLSKNQINELVNVMRAYTALQKNSGRSFDSSIFKNVEGNPVINAWNKYLTDSSVCEIEFKE